MTSTLSFGPFVIADDRPAVIIAEVACEHQGSLDAAKRLVDLAQASADIVKFQLHLPADEMIPGSVTFWAGSMDDVLAKVNLPASAHGELARYCEAAGIEYLCTPFCARAADVLAELGVIGFKIGSGELTNVPMLRHVALKRKPMIVSTGMATLGEIDRSVAALREEGAAFALMNCTSAYPPRYEDIQLGLIRRLAERYDVPIGQSDHTPEIWVPIGAVVAGARIVEKHFTADRALRGPDAHVSLEPHEFRTMVDAIRKIERALGSHKQIADAERDVRRWAHHSVVSLTAIPAGTTLTSELIGVKRPGWGVPAHHLPDFIGRVAKRDIAANALLSWEDV